MKRYLFVLAIISFIFVSAFPARAVNVFKHYDKVIWIDQPRQEGAAYEKRQKLFSFRIMSGDDATPTPPGAYVVRVKDADYYSRKYKQPMPYSIFFDYKGKRAIHEGDVADRNELAEWATHGCIHVEEPYMKRLFDWTEKGKTLVVIRGKRDWALEEQIGEVEEGIHENKEDQGEQESGEQQEDQQVPKNQPERQKDQEQQAGQD